MKTTTTCTVCPYDDAVLDPVYVPWPLSTLREHFAPAPGSGVACRHLHYYVKSAQRAQAHRQTSSLHSPACNADDHQIEKDERFWVMGALLAAFHGPDRIGALSLLLGKALGEQPPVEGGFSTWRDALGSQSDLRLYFEANLPAPVPYKASFTAGTPLNTLIPHTRAIAQDKLSCAGQSAPALEGKTWVDALLVSTSTGVAVAFEAKVLSDVSTHTTYDDTRNQIARNLDVLLERNPKVCQELQARRPERSCFVLLTPRKFRAPGTRLYGHLMEQYRQGGPLLQEHLPHRSAKELEGVARRLGWLTFEDVQALVPGACPWL